MKSLEQQLREAFPELTDAHFGHHASDLYVVATPAIALWLKRNYKWYRNVTTFIGSGDWFGRGRACFDIPFAHCSCPLTASK